MPTYHSGRWCSYLQHNRSAQLTDHCRRCIRVSKAWHHTITTLPNLWYNIDLSGAPAYLKSSTAQGKRNGSVSNEFISACIRRSQNKIRTVRLQNLRSRDKVVYALATSCKQLQSLCTSQSGLYSETFINSIAPTTSLKRLEIGPAGTIRLSTVMSLLKASPQLEHFASIVDPGQGVTVQNDATAFSPGLRSFSLRVIEAPRLGQQSPSIRGFVSCQVFVLCVLTYLITFLLGPLRRQVQGHRDYSLRRRWRRVPLGSRYTRTLFKPCILTVFAPIRGEK